jgi:alpha-glucosidase
MRKFARLLVVLCGLVSSQLWSQNASSRPEMPPNRFASSPDWWKTAVFYEIYPRSFGDSDNNGTGDLPGITEHLDYLRMLGIDAIWITPCFPSPQVDFGYDVSDYHAIDPQYGTLADFDTLVAEAKRRGIKVILDFVVNHTSDQHQWFQESRKSRTNPYRDYYIWRDGKEPGKPPNNWLSVFGGSAWQYDATAGQWYYHAFDPRQPDLNWRNPAVEKQMFDVTRFWYRRGVYGFRLDAVDTLFEDSNLRDNPSSPERYAFVMNQQQRLYTANLPEVHTELQSLRQVADEFSGRILIGETWTSTPAQLASYYGPTNNELEMPMYFNFTMINKLSASQFREKIAAIENNTVSGWPVFVLSNHDIRRWLDRYGDGVHDPQIAKLMSALYLTLRGTPIMYYGEEIGMTNSDPTRLEDVKDVVGKKGWPKEKGRDGERTPMQWDNTTNAGFNTGTRTWLPVSSSYKTSNVALEDKDPNSLLNWYRSLIALRRTVPALFGGEYLPLRTTDVNVLSYMRQEGKSRVLVVLNMSGSEQTVKFDSHEIGASAEHILLSSAALWAVSPAKIKVEPYGVVIAELK